MRREFLLGLQVRKKMRRLPWRPTQTGEEVV
jgi:hypothetical protein